MSSRMLLLKTTVRRVSAGCATILGIALGMTLLVPALHAEEWTKSYAVSERPQVRIHTNDGAVRVYTWEAKQIEFRVEYHGYELGKDLKIDARQDGPRIELDAHLASRFCVFCISTNRVLRIEVRMPRAADLTVETGDGSVESEGVQGRLEIRTGDGHISVQGAQGEIRLRTGDGHIEARGVDGALDATTGDGHISVEGRFDVLNIKTGDGSVEARIGAGSKMKEGWSISTGDGRVDAEFPEGFQANLDAKTRDGRISTDLPLTVEGEISKSSVQGKLNGGGPQLTIRTGDGSVRLHRG
jgi:DUF4097 and DUF4098 domain-containing protein YvlB